MKAKFIKAAGLFTAGVLMVTVSYKADGAGNTSVQAAEQIPAVETVSAGVSSELAAQLDGSVLFDTAVSSGVTGTLASYMEEAAEYSAGVVETDNVMTASGQKEEQEEKDKKEAMEAAAREFGYQNLGVVQADGNVNVRKEPGTEAEIAGKMPENAGCEILGTDGEWTRIKSGEVEGFVKSEYLLTGEAAIAKAQEVKQTLATVTTETLYVREQPNTDCEVVTMMPKGEELEVLEQLDGWIKINVDSDEGYVSSDYVKLSTQLLKAQTLTEMRYGQGVSDVRVSLAQYATQFIGNPYVWGGTSLTNGADCSGFVLSVFAKYGVSLPHSSRAQANCGTSISLSEAQPGDLIFYSNGRQINHVAIYIGGGRVVHASSPKSGIKTSGATYRTPVKVVRVLK